MNSELQMFYTMHAVDVDIYIEREFATAYDEVSKYSGLGAYRMRQLWQAVGQVAKLPAGDLLEVGTYRGGSARMIQHAMQYFNLEAKLTACDTFAGLVKASPEHDVWKSGEMVQGDVEAVRGLLPGVQVLQGVFPEETGHELAGSTFRFAHIDVDIYQSAKDIWVWLWPRLVQHAIVVFDDVEIGDTPGITALAKELSSMQNAYWLRNNMGQALAIKL